MPRQVSRPGRSAAATAVLAAALALARCAPIPYQVPHGTPAHPIVTSGYFALPDGARLPYRLYPAAGPVRAVILALHGYTDSRDAWETLAKTLNPQGIAIYAPDQSGFGATPNRGHWPGTATLVDEARDMAVILRAQYPDEKLVLMGESMGGAIGLILGASANPPPVDAYVLSAPAVWGGPALNPLLRISLDVSAAIVPAKRVTGGFAHVKASDNHAALEAFSKDPLTIHEPTVANVDSLVHLMATAQAACAHFSEPALILYGGKDQLVPPDAMASCWRQIPPGPTLAYYPPDYHLIERDNERAVPSADILAFVLGKSLPSNAPSEATVFLAVH